jgi:hypothetical protein
MGAMRLQEQAIITEFVRKRKELLTEFLGLLQRPPSHVEGAQTMTRPKCQPSVVDAFGERLCSHVIVLDCRSTVAVAGDKLSSEFDTKSQLEIYSLLGFPDRTQ